MTSEQIVRKNLDLLAEFMKYAFEHAEVLDKIPPDGELLILPENDPQLYQENLKTLEKLRKEGKKIAVFRMELPKTIVPKLAETIT